jgi:DNA-dependent metalloprotease WSS1
MRAADEKKCASGALAQQEADRAARDCHHSNAIDLTGDFDFSEDLIILDDGPSGSTSPNLSRLADPQPSSRRKSPLRSQTAVTQRSPPGVNVLTRPRPPPVNNASKPLAESTWTCTSCTLINQALALQCDACLTMRPLQPDAQVTGPAAPTGWTCGVCGEDGMEHTFWTCRFCGSVKTESTFG